MTDKEFDKFWVNLYMRNDCCSSKEKQQINKKCTFEPSMKKDIWDFNHNAMTDIRSFLELMSPEES